MARTLPDGKSVTSKVTEGWEISPPSFSAKVTEGWEISPPSFSANVTEGWEVNPPPIEGDMTISGPNRDPAVDTNFDITGKSTDGQGNGRVINLYRQKVDGDRIYIQTLRPDVDGNWSYTDNISNLGDYIYESETVLIVYQTVVTEGWEIEPPRDSWIVKVTEGWEQ